MSVEGSPHDLRSLGKFQLFYKTEGYIVVVVGTELYTWDAHVFYVGLVWVPAWGVSQAWSTVLGTYCSLFIAKHLEVILENINNLIGREGIFDPPGNLVDKSFELGIEIIRLATSSLLAYLVDEITGLILTTCIDHSVVISLAGESFHLVSRLQANLKDHLFLGNRLCTFIADILEVRSAFTWVLLLHGCVIVTKETALFWHSNADQCPTNIVILQLPPNQTYLEFLGFRCSTSFNASSPYGDT